MLIGRGKRIDSVQPEKNSTSRKSKKKCCTPFSCLGGPNDPTEREHIPDYLMWMDTTEDGRGHQFAVACAKYTVRTDSAGEAQDSLHGPKHVFLHRNGTKDHEQPSFRSARSHALRRELRHALATRTWNLTGRTPKRECAVLQGLLLVLDIGFSSRTRLETGERKNLHEQ